MEYKCATLELKREPDEDGRFEGYASVFNHTDQGGDIVAPGAFTKSLGKRMPKLLWQHDPRQVIGKYDSVTEDERGLFVTGRLFKDVKQGMEAMTLLKEGAIDSMSIGYRTVEAAMEGPSERIRKLLEVDLFEVSLVTFPMNELATITDVKALHTERDFERFLRDAGFSRKEATAIALHGFKAKDEQRDAVADEANEGLSALFNQIKQLQEKING